VQEKKENAMPNIIRHLRVAKKWNQSTLAEKVGVSQRRISDIERGIEPTAAEVEKIIKIFGLKGKDQENG
jgi:transcriptional regulator with XRE-family HTH domain